MPSQTLLHSYCGENTKKNCIFSLETADFRESENPRDITFSACPVCVAALTTSTEPGHEDSSKSFRSEELCELAAQAGKVGTTGGLEGWTPPQIPSLCSPPVAFGKTQGGLG